MLAECGCRSIATAQATRPVAIWRIEADVHFTDVERHAGDQDLSDGFVEISEQRPWLRILLECLVQSSLQFRSTSIWNGSSASLAACADALRCFSSAFTSFWTSDLKLARQVVRSIDWEDDPLYWPKAATWSCSCGASWF